MKFIQYFYIIKNGLAKIMPNRKDLLYHWVLIIYISEITTFIKMQIAWSLLAVMIAAALIEGMDYLSKKGSAQWSDFIVTTLAGWSIIGLHTFGNLIFIN